MKAPLAGVPDGGAPTVLATHPDVNSPRGIAVDGSRVYWADAKALKSVPKSGGCVTTLAAESIGPFLVVVDGANVYWTDQGFFPTLGLVRKMPIAGGCITTITTGWDNIGLAVDGANVYFASQPQGNPPYAPGFIGKAPK